jgi:trk system potassium uptake protein TrkA
LKEKDQLTLFGHPDTLFNQREKFDPRQKIESTSVVLFGGSETTINLVRMLTNPRFKIRVIEKDPEQCELLANLFPHIEVINGDATSLRLLEEEQIGFADYFVACTKNDEENILTCIQASKLGAKHVQLVINKSDYDKLINSLKKDLNIEVVVSPRVTMTEYMRKYLTNTQLTALAELPNNAGQILQLIIPHNSPAIGKKIKDVALPKGTLLVALLHKFKAKVPAGDDTIITDDRLIVITGKTEKKTVLKKLLG